LLAKLAREMKHAPLQKWVALETNGYLQDNPAMDESVNVPKHRFVPGQRFNEYEQVMIVQDAGLHFINQMPLRHGVAELERLAKRSNALTCHDALGAELLQEHFGPQYAQFRYFRMSPDSIHGVLSGIRSEAIDWLYKIKPEIDALRAESRGLRLGGLTRASSTIDVAALHDHIQRIEHSIEKDPAQAIGSAKELAETVAKHVLEQYGEDPEQYDTFPRLAKAAIGKLDLAADAIGDADKGATAMKMVIGGLGSVAEGTAALRNLYGTGHGRTRSSGAQVRHARAVVGACHTLATFMLETLEARRGRP